MVAKVEEVVETTMAQDVLAIVAMVLASTSYAEASRRPCRTVSVRDQGLTFLGPSVGQGPKSEG